MIAKKYFIPNSLTALNLLCGSAAIISLFENQPERPYVPVFLIGLAAVFDLLDGLSAKLVHATSEFGKQLDSLADMVSFGLAPALMLYKLLIIAFTFQSNSATFLVENASIIERLLLYSSLLLAVFAALRLARYNIATSASVDFVGLPVPASALFVVSMWLEFHITENDFVRELLINPYVLFSTLAFLSFLMVSNVSMISLKFTGKSFILNRWRYILIGGAALIYIYMGTSALFLILLYYIVLSFIKNLVPGSFKE